MKLDILTGDCLELLKNIPDKSIDLILSDPPYGTTKCDWDSVIPFEPMWEQLNRVIKDNGAILLFAQSPFDKILGASNIKNLKYEWIWEKTQATGFLNAKKAPMKAHENILVFYKKAPFYNPQKTTGHKPVNSYTKKANVQNKTEIYGKVKEDISGGGETERYPRSVLKFSSDKQKNKLTGLIHPTQKPVALLEYLIKTYTQEGEMVLDFAAGSFSTAVACLNTNRNFIGMEINPDYVEIGKKRLNYYD